MPQSSPTKRQISKWKKAAKKLSQENNQPYKDILDKIANDNGYDSWRHIQNCRDKTQPLSFQDDSEFDNLPKQARRALDRGDIQERASFITLDSEEIKQAKKELCDHLEKIIRRSRSHFHIKVTCYIRSNLSDKVKTDYPTLFEEIHNQYERIDVLHVIESDKGMPLSAFSNTSTLAEALKDMEGFNE